MIFREIDDRYPEYARPYEPVKGGKHHKKLSLPSPFLPGTASVLLLIFMITASLPVSLPSPAPAAGTSALNPETPLPPQDAPSPSAPENTPAPTSTEEPAAAPSPEPNSDAEPASEAEPASAPEPAPDSTPNSDSEPASDSTPASDSDPEQSYTDPTLEIAHVYYWECLGHIEVEYVVTPNDAEDLHSVAVLTSYADPSMTLTMPAYNGSGTIDANADGTDRITYISADEWKTDVTLTYKLDGEEKTLTASHTGQPEFQGFLWLSSSSTSSSGDVTAKTVTGDLLFRYPEKDRHTYNVTFTGMDVGWMKEVPLEDGGFTYETVGGTRTVWNGSGTSPISGPSGPTTQDNEKVLTFSHNITTDVTPDAEALAAGATHFYLIARMSGTGTDTDGTVYTVHYPTSGQGFPQPLSSGSPSYTEPAAVITDVRYWGDLNVPGGLRHLEVVYDITPGDADPGSITSYAEVSWVEDPSRSVTLDTVSGSGTFASNKRCDASFFPSSASEWLAKVHLEYTIGGDARTKTVSWQGRPDLNGFWMTADYLTHQGPVDSMTANYEINFECEADDRHDYKVYFTKAEIEWVDEYENPVGSPAVIWEGGDPSPYYGPYPYTDGEYRGIGYSFYDNDIDATPPSPEAVKFRLIFSAEGSGTDSYYGTVYPLSYTMSWYTECVDLP